jgi:hypothetical protein
MWEEIIWEIKKMWEEIIWEIKKNVRRNHLGNVKKSKHLGIFFKCEEIKTIEKIP